MSSERPRRSSVAPTERPPEKNRDTGLVDLVKQIVRDAWSGLEELLNPPTLVPIPVRPRRRR